MLAVPAPRPRSFRRGGGAGGGAGSGRTRGGALAAEGGARARRFGRAPGAAGFETSARAHGKHSRALSPRQAGREGGFLASRARAAASLGARRAAGRARGEASKPLRRGWRVLSACERRKKGEGGKGKVSLRACWWVRVWSRDGLVLAEKSSRWLFASGGAGRAGLLGVRRRAGGREQHSQGGAHSDFPCQCVRRQKRRTRRPARGAGLPSACTGPGGALGAAGGRRARRMCLVTPRVSEPALVARLSGAAGVGRWGVSQSLFASGGAKSERQSKSSGERGGGGGGGGNAATLVEESILLECWMVAGEILGGKGSGGYGIRTARGRANSFVLLLASPAPPSAPRPPHGRPPSAG